MTSVSAILLLCAVSNLAMIGYVLWRRHTRPAHFAFAAVVVSLACWNFFNFLILLCDNPETVTLLGRASFASGSLIGTSYLVFTWFFPERNHVTPSPFILRATVLSGAIVFVLCLTPLVQASVEWGDFGKRPVFGPLFAVYVSYMIAAFFWSTCNLLRVRGRTAPGMERMQLNYTLIGFAVAFVVVSLTNFIVPLFTERPESCMLGGGLGTLFISVLTAYAILRYRLMDIGIALRSVLVHGLTGGILAGLFLPTIMALRLALGDAPPIVQACVTLGLAFVVALVVAPLQRGVALFVDRWLFQGRYDHEAALLRLGNRLSETYGQENIASIVATEIPIIIQACAGIVYVPGRESGAFCRSALSGDVRGPVPEQLAADNEIVACLRERHTTITKEEAGSGLLTHHGDEDAMLETFNALGASLATPLLAKTQLLGILFLGGKKGDNAFTSDEIDLLGALASQAASALDNARLYEEVLQAQRHYETILRHMQRGVLTVDPALNVVTLNETGATILGAQTQQWVGQSIREFVPCFAECLELTLAEGVDQAPREVSVTAGDRTMPCECETTSLVDARGNAAGAMLVFQDLTDKRRFEQKVRRMDRLASVGTLAAGMAHEIKNPLVSIQTFAQLLPERYQDCEFRESFSNIVISEVNRINTLVQSLLHFARPRQRQTGQVNVVEVLERTLELLSSQLSKQQVDVVRDFPDELIQVRGDAQQLHQVFLNLLQNAVQAMSEGERRITLCLRKGVARTEHAQGDEALRLTIEDTGRGIEDEHLDRIFDPFFTTKADGSGLGLAICHSILEEHGAGIDVNSAPGRGTTFVLTLPLSQ